MASWSSSTPFNHAITYHPADGEQLPIAAVKVKATGTTASQIVGWWCRATSAGPLVHLPWIDTWAERYRLRQADAITTVSSSLRDHLVERYDPELRQRLDRAAAERVATSLTWPDSARSAVAACELAIARRRAASR